MSLTPGLTGRFYRYLRGAFALRPSDVMLAAFPKSGSTWVRFFFAHLLCRDASHPVVDFAWLNANLPELGASDLARPWSDSTVPRIIKTHRRYLPIFRRTRSLLLLRDPRDVMVSYFEYERGKRSPRFSGGFHDFLVDSRFGLPAWYRHTESWLKRATVVIRYEELKANEVDTFGRLLERLDVPLPPDAVRTAAEASRFDRVKNVERKYGHQRLDRHRPDFEFAREGRSGGWRERFDDDALALYDQLKRQHGLDIY